MIEAAHQARCKHAAVTLHARRPGDLWSLCGLLTDPEDLGITFDQVAPPEKPCVSCTGWLRPRLSGIGMMP